jgi:hypothetical protein
MARLASKLKPKQEEAIAALLTQRSVEDAARTVGLGTRTLMRWLTLPEFDAAYRQARRDAFAQTTARLQQASGTAVSALLKVMVDPNSPASARVRAADCVLGHASKAIEDIEARVAELEKSVEGSQGKLR